MAEIKRYEEPPRHLYTKFMIRWSDLGGHYWDLICHIEDPNGMKIKKYVWEYVRDSIAEEY